MQRYSESDNYVLYQGNMLNMLNVIKENSIDSIITDPPYGLTSITKRFGKENSAPAQYGKDGAFSRLSRGFMGKEWDGSGIEYSIETWQKCYEVLKPGGYLLAFGGSRTYHRIACAIEDAGFEIRDCIMWLYGSGFPKSMSISKGIEAKEKYGKANTIVKRLIEQNCEGEEYKIKQTNNGAMGELIETTRKHYTPTSDLATKWNGWGTCLKPAYEPIIVARKPFKGSLVDNVIENGVGGLNIDECRIETNDTWHRKEAITNTAEGYQRKNKSMYAEKTEGKMHENGRFPANVIHDGLQEEWSRYFYCAKASKKDRDEGLDNFEDNYMAYSNQAKAELKRGNIDFKGNEDNPLNFVNKISVRKNTHPTVKPTELMQYLVRLVTPKNGVILDPFMGSGSTGKACMYENKERNANYKFIGIELTEEYLPIAEARINYAMKQAIEENKERQLTLFEKEE